MRTYGHSKACCSAATVRGRRCRRPAGAEGVCHVHRSGYTRKQARGSSVVGPRHRRNDRLRSEAAAARRDRVQVLYEQGLSTEEIAEALGQSFGAARNHILRLRKEGRIGYRARPFDVEIDGALAVQVRAAWVEDCLSIQAIGKQFGWNFNRAWGVIQRLREEGYDLPSRKGGPIDVQPTEQQKVREGVKARRRRAARSGPSPEISDKQKVVLRILEAAERPLSTVEVHRFCNLCGQKLSKECVRSRLLSAQKAGHVDRATGEVRRWFERGAGRWFIPAEARHTAKRLTLADAERESELAALIDSQREELQLGSLSKFEKGHWDKSLDAPVTADGFTILDTLGAEDESLQELIGEPA